MLYNSTIFNNKY